MHRSRTIAIPILVLVPLLAAALPSAVGADDWFTVDAEQSSVLVEEDKQLKKLDPVFQQLFLPDQGMDVKLTSIIQLFPIDPELFDAGPVKKAKASATVGAFRPAGTVNVGQRTKKFDKQGNVAISERISASENAEFFFVDWEFKKKYELPAGTSILVRTGVEVVDPNADDGCFDATTHCLNHDRFKVDVDWRDFSGNSGPGIAFPRTDDSGLFFFFDPDNTEMLIKVLDGCRSNDRYWVFYAATTDVEFEVTVTDTLSGQSRVFDNPLGNPASAILDTQAFATCP